MVIKDITNKSGEVFLKTLSKYGYIFLKSKGELKKKTPWGEVTLQFYVANYNPKFLFAYTIGVAFKEVNIISNNILQEVYDHIGLNKKVNSRRSF